jgi:hypothetical protein
LERQVGATVCPKKSHVGGVVSSRSALVGVSEEVRVVQYVQWQSGELVVDGECAAAKTSV